MMRRQALQPNRVSFQVAEVAPGSKRFSEIPVRAVLERTVRSPLVAFSPAPEKVVEGGDFHPLIAAAALAYKKHLPLVLSPDVIWLTILQGVAQHIGNHSNALRSRLVPHETRIELVVETSLSKLPETDAQMMAATKPFVELIRKHVLSGKHFLLDTEFSTTTDAERIAGAVVIMDSFQPYFDYVFSIICGIPSVALEGTTADWEMLAKKVRMLHESDLELSWWTKHLLPLCEHFIRASRGDVDRSHWNDLCKLVERYGVDDLNGWLLKFIPYVRQDRNEVPRHRNPVLELTKFPLDKEKMGRITGCTSNMLPTGLSFAPVTCLNQKPGATTSYQFVAGFCGVVQSSEDLSLRAGVGWAIADAARIDKLMTRLRTEQSINPPQSHDTESLVRIFEGNLPGDLWKFYTGTGGATLECKKSDRDTIYCTINAASQTKLAIEFEYVERELKHLLKQGILTPSDYEARRRFALAYSHLRIFAESYEGKSHYFYVFGSDPEQFHGLQVKESRAQIFRWSGEHAKEAFEPVAHTFSEWLEAMLDRTKAENLS